MSGAQPPGGAQPQGRAGMCYPATLATVRERRLQPRRGKGVGAALGTAPLGLIAAREPGLSPASPPPTPPPHPTAGTALISALRPGPGAPSQTAPSPPASGVVRRSRQGRRTFPAEGAHARAAPC